MYLNETSIKIILESAEKSKIEIKHPGVFTDWCKKQGFDGVTCECVCKAMSTNDPTLHKRANFAYTFAFKNHNKTCECMEKRKKEKKKKNRY